MKRIKTIGIFIFLQIVMINCGYEKKEKIQLILPAHSHNDYEHVKPLIDAIDYKFKISPTSFSLIISCEIGVVINGFLHAIYSRHFTGMKNLHISL